MLNEAKRSRPMGESVAHGAGLIGIWPVFTVLNVRVHPTRDSIPFITLLHCVPLHYPFNKGSMRNTKSSWILKTTRDNSQEQYAVRDGKLRPRCRHQATSSKQRRLTSNCCQHLANWMKHTCRL